MTDRPLPSNPDAERSILGGIILENDLIHQAAAMLRAEDFFLDSHRRIFTAAIELSAESKPIDTLTLAEQLGKVRQLESIGGVAYITSLTDGVPRRHSLEHYIKLLRGKADLRQLINICRSGAMSAYAQDTTAEDVAGKIMENLYAIEGAATQGNIRHAREFMGETLTEMERQSKLGKDALLGLSTGVLCIDRATNGIRDGEVWVIGALPGRGKTALGVQIGEANASQDVPTLVFSIEMTRSQVGRRLLAQRTNVGARKIRNPNWLSNSEWGEIARTAGEIMDWPLWIDDASELNTRQLAARARLYIRKHKIRLIVVDYLMLVDAPEEKEARHKARKIAETLRRVAKDETRSGNPVSVVLLSQLSRPKDKDINRRPTMIDLRESGDIEAAAHVVLLIYTPLDESGQPTGEDELILGKNREGVLGSMPVLYDRQRLRFEERGARHI